MKKVLIILVLASSFTFSKAQQLPIYSQYMFNPYIMNPAYAGVKDYYEAIANYRYQWVGITDAPRTYILSVNGPHKTKNIGLGGAIFADVVGPTSRTAAYGSYAYHLNLGSSKLSLGLSAGLLQFRIDGQKITLADAGDTKLQDMVLTAVMPDFSMGAYWYSDKMYVGVSLPQFMKNKINFYDDNTQTLSTLARHYFVNTGYKYQVNPDWMIEPSILVKYVWPVDAQFTLGAKVVYRDFVWGGISWRSQDAMSALIGYKTNNDKLYIGYAYDITMTNLQNHSSGTHELMIAAKFNNWKQRTDKMKKKLEELEESNSLLEEEIEEKLDEEETASSEETSEESSESEEDLSSMSKEELEAKDKELRDNLRQIRENATAQGFDSPDSDGFSGKEEYLATLQKINDIYFYKQGQ